MLYPDELRAAAESFAEGFDRKTLMKAASAVSQRYREERADGSVLVSTGAETAAYAVTRMPATFAAVGSALSHALSHYTGESASAADLGAGTGAAGWAASMLIDGLETLHLYERSEAMSALGKKLMDTAEIPADTLWSSLDITAGTLPRSYDLITASYVFNELKESDRDRAVLGLWEKTDGMLLITEPGTKAGYSVIAQIRKLLIKNGALICYPCPGNGECPLPDGDWCHFTARAARSKLHKQLKNSEVPYEDEKFSCIAAVRNGAKPCGSRILRHPITESGLITLHVCTGTQISDMKITRSSKLFKAARKAECGDCI